MTMTILTGESDRANSVGVSIADTKATATLTGEKECEAACPSNRQPTDAFEEAIRLLAHRKWKAAECPAGVGVDVLLEAEREETAPSGDDQAPLRDRNLSLRQGRSDESFAATRGDFAMQSRNLLPCEELDCDLVQRVKRFLHQKGHAPHRTLEISVERGKVVVQGRVPTFYLRQIAVECIKRVGGVTQIVDRIDVVDRPGSRQSNDNSEDEQSSSDPSMWHHVDLPDLERTTQGVPHTQINCCHLLSSGTETRRLR